MKRFSIYLLVIFLFIVGIIIFNKPITNNEVIVIEEKKIDKKKMKEKLTLSNSDTNIPLVLIEENKNEEKVHKVLDEIENIKDDVLKINGSEFYFWNFWSIFENSNDDDENDIEIEEDLWRI